MIRRVNFAVALAVFTLLFAGSPKTAHAQLGWTFVGVGEFDTDDVVLVLGGVTVAPRREGWAPLAGLSAYWLRYPIVGTAGNDNRTVTSIVPAVGLQNSFGSGAFQARVGYAFTDSDNDDNLGGVPAFTAEAGDDGVVTTAQVDYWGSGAWNAQAIGTYNFGAEALWARGRLGRRLFTVGDAGSLGLGAEVAFLDSDEYGATKVGGVVNFNPGRGTTLNAAVGRKLGHNDVGNATYFTFELVLYPR